MSLSVSRLCLVEMDYSLFDTGVAHTFDVRRRVCVCECARTRQQPRGILAYPE